MDPGPLRILVVDDEEKVASSLRKGLEEAGYSVDTAHRGESGLALALAGTYHAIILDVMMPDLDGVDVLRRLRESGVDTKLLLLTAVTGVQEKIRALNLGADDYLTKPFDFQELLARLSAILRRGTFEKSDVLRAGAISLDRRRKSVMRDGVEVAVTAREYALLEFLLQHKNEVVSRNEIAQSVWNYGYEAETNVIDVYINYLRRKIDAGGAGSTIVTVRGRGYMIADP